MDSLDTVAYGPDGATERELRLLGDVKGKRVLELGCGTGAAAVALAKQGAVVIGVDGSDDRVVQARTRADAAEARVDWRVGDLADLAFLRADSIDVVLSVHAISEVDDSARVFRQVERVLRPNAPFVFSFEHPFALCVDADGTLRHPPSDRGPIEVDGRLLYVRSFSEVFTDLHRAGLRTDNLLELRGAHAKVPSTVVWRARPDGA
jgi:ubiquinone/menaquinone biosynthesis C-methylase UbiE